MSAVFFFYCGVIVQAFFLIRRKLNLLHWILIPATFLFCFLSALIPSSKESHYNTYLHLFLGAFIFSLAYAIWFKKDVLQKVRKEILFLWFFILLSLIIKDFTAQFFVLKIFIITLSLPIILGMFFPLGGRSGIRIYSYVWFLCVLLFVSCSQFIFSDLLFFIKNGEGIPQMSFSMLFVGSSFLYLMVNFWYLFEILPFPAKNQTLDECLEEVKKNLAELGEKYDTKANSTSKPSLFTYACCTIIMVNSFFSFIKTETMIAIAITVLPYLSSLLEQEELATLPINTNNEQALSLPRDESPKIEESFKILTADTMQSPNPLASQSVRVETGFNFHLNSEDQTLPPQPPGSIRIEKGFKIKL